MKKGFTLVELAIVLVIVGLIIGGILVAQSILSATRVTAQIKQLQQFDIAVNNYMTNYKKLPGDSNSNGYLNTTFNGDVPPNKYSSQGEVYGFFPDLYQKGMIKGPYGTVAGYYVGPGTAFPKAEMAKASNFGIAATGNISGQIFWDMAVSEAVNGIDDPFDQLAPSGIFSSSDSAALDTKIDDGIPGSGNVVAAHSCCGGNTNKCGGNVEYFGTSCTGTSGVPYPISLDTNSNCVTGTAPYQYKTSSTGSTSCQLLVKSDATP